MLRRERAERTRAIENPAPKDLPNAERRANLCACAMRTSSSATPNLPLQANVAEDVDYAGLHNTPGSARVLCIIPYCIVLVYQYAVYYCLRGGRLYLHTGAYRSTGVRGEQV